MKRLIQHTVLLLFVLGCKNDPLDITPDGRITLADVFSDERRTEAYLNTVYSQIPSYFYKYHFNAFFATVTDEAEDGDVGNEPGVMAAQWITGNLTPSFNPLALAGQGKGTDRYQTCWAGIRHANVFLANIGDAPVRGESFRTRMTAEARLLRAFYYLELIKFYGPLPVISEPFSSDFEYSSLQRPSFQEITDFIVADCDWAIASSELPVRITLEAERGRFTKAVAHAIKSQTLLHNASALWNGTNATEKWQAAAVAGRAAKDFLEANGYTLYPDYGDYFLRASDVNTNPQDKETIFEIPERPAATFVIVNSIPSMPGQYKSGACPTQELVDSYGMKETGESPILGYEDDNHLNPIINDASGYDPANPYVGRDPRFYHTVWYNGAEYDNIAGSIHIVETFNGGRDQLIKTPPNRKNTHTGYYLRKFMDPKLQPGHVPTAQFKKYRLAEIYLNLAEALNEVEGPVQEVYDAVNAVRARSEMPDLPAGLTKEAMRDRIRNERRVEFAFEEHRFFDVRRWKILGQTDKLITGMEIRKTGESLTYHRFIVGHRSAWEDKYLLLPIPRSDAAVIPDFTANQNPGW
ncbi:MAG TPA: RagB/SusD family nutrient uptake outer membrane protein [Parapedobacter sp.]|uniref:RagB/SusD family nutrient uptake outer membrane protein n=1 Tax=Parapedobacter sp. TaxID=1958893 RepID=UPI002B7ED085|nr:RagB/SusD family nutrient uptake outer membrane protein [Parapedobacter sp.]HWK58489.1 RagB/SusD family nutrient uptake outer membrane protein [Parapedobacter sp.]